MWLAIQILLSLSLKASSTTLILAIGETRSFSPPMDSQIWVSDRSVIRASEHGALIVLVARKTGVAKVKIGNHSYNFRVLSKKMARSFRKIKRAIRNKSIFGKVEGVWILIEGQIADLQTYTKLVNATANQSIKYKMHATVKASAQSNIKNWIEHLFQSSFLPQPKILFSPQLKIILPKISTPLKRQALHLSRTLGVEVQFSENYIAKEPVIEILLEFVEIAHATATQFGLNWPGSVQASMNSELLSEMKKQIIFHALEESGGGQILARPTLTTRNGIATKFHSGGEIPIRSHGYKSSSVQWKSYGMTFNLHPQLAGDIINIAVKIEISHIDGSTSADGVPGLRKTIIENNIQVRKNRTSLITGVILGENHRGKKGIPLLSQIPILSKLFSSSSYRNRRSELVLFITPRVH